ncbi:Inorganic pyrophosphatase 2 [Hibiscus syriacus]|uniref:Inorganic pyrophosphatase 2 n=1 Tax=Hibiscus syriacus TaxID=106335 RepID=A0A6A2XQW1_HIBSY|nr:Inorganic pyrophosphatase 2 [Hibiscus syriacus]
MMKELHSQGTSVEDIVAVLKRTPIHPRIVEAIKSVHALGCDLKIVSDANTFFIETILEHHGLKECFSEIQTNSGFVDEQGKLRIFPHHDFTKSSHGCVHPSVRVLWLRRYKLSLYLEDQKKTIIYLGDGLGDFCPSLKLGDGDYVMPRKGFPVWDLICKNESLTKPQICEWSNGEDLEIVLHHFITLISIEGNHSSANIAELYSVDCKQETMPLPAASVPQPFHHPLHQTAGIVVFKSDKAIIDCDRPGFVQPAYSLKFSHSNKRYLQLNVKTVQALLLFSISIKTIIDCDSDNWVVDELGATELFEQLLPTMPWNSLMDRMMKELPSQGTRIGDIEAVLKRTPIHPRIIEAIKSAHALGCDLKIVSDANTFFIEKILEHQGLRECFSEIHTNPSFVDEEGGLRIFPHHDFNKSSHGHGRLCNAKGFQVWDLICENTSLIKPQIWEWSNGEDFENVLLHLITRISIHKNNSTSADIGLLHSVDCKLETMQLPAATNAEAFTRALHVFH